jgi:aryl-alcohol dehydrogenase-like predicted oxidoreductase
LPRKTWLYAKADTDHHALAYLFHQSTYVFPIVEVHTVKHVKAMPEALRARLSGEDIEAIHNAAPFNPLNNFLLSL